MKSVTYKDPEWAEWFHSENRSWRNSKGVIPCPILTTGALRAFLREDWEALRADPGFKSIYGSG